MATPIQRSCLPRRAFLKGVGAAIALPLLDAMRPALARASTAVGSRQNPRRCVFIFAPNGKAMADWRPAADGVEFELPPTLQPLAAVRSEVQILGGLTLNGGRAHGDGPGDHARAAGSYLTAAHPFKTGGADLRAGVSIDQCIAGAIGEATRFPSLELGCEGGRQAGECDSGYSCAYSNNISWRTESTPAVKEVDPRKVFDRLFGGADQLRKEADQGRRLRARQSVLDLVLEDAHRLRGTLGPEDRRKLDEYLTSVREVEQRVARASAEGGLPEPPDGAERPSGIPGDYGEHVRLMFDLIALAFRTDLTRTVTFMLGNAGSNRSYRNLDVPDGHHSLSHHKNDPENLRKLARINRFHVEQFAGFLAALRETREENANLLDQCMIVYGSALADPNRHEHHDLPILLAGRGGGSLQPGGRHQRFASETPLANLYLSLLDRLEIPADSFADSTGRLDPL